MRSCQTGQRPATKSLSRNLTGCSRRSSSAFARERVVYSVRSRHFQQGTYHERRWASMSTTSPSRRPLEQDDAADALAGVQQIKPLVDVLEPERMGDHRVDLDLARHVPVDDL